MLFFIYSNQNDLILFLFTFVTLHYSQIDKNIYLIDNVQTGEELKEKPK